MIQIEFLGSSSGSARPAATRANDPDAASFLNVFARGEGETAQAPAEPVERDPDTADPEATDLVADGAGEEAALLVGAGGDDLLAAHDDRVAAAIAAADPEAAAAAGQALSSAGMVPAMAGEAEASGDAEGRTPPIAERGVFPEGAPKAGGALSVRPADVQFVGRASAVPPGGAAIDPASNPGGSGARGGQTIAVQVGPGAGAEELAAMPAQSGPPGGDLQSPGIAALAARSQGEGAGPGLAKAITENPGVPGFSDTLPDKSELPARIAAFPARLTGESAASVVANPSAQLVLAAPDPTLTGMTAAQGAAAVEIKAEAPAVPASGDEFSLASGTSTNASSRTAYPMLFAAPEPQRVTRQIAEAVRQGSDGSIELALSPKELGSVRMSIHATETGTAIMMSAERDETMQLLRRHADMLHEAFRELGLGTLDLSFGGREGQAARPEPRGSDAAGLGAAAPGESTDVSEHRSSRLAGGGLDLRM